MVQIAAFLRTSVGHADHPCRNWTQSIPAASFGDAISARSVWKETNSYQETAFLPN